MRDLMFVVAIIGVILFMPACMFAFYILVGYMDWLSQDPLNIIVDQRVEEKVDKNWEDAKAICEKSGGIAIRSSWDGQLKECRKPLQ